MPAPLGKALLVAVLRRRAGIPDNQIRLRKAVFQFFGVNGHASGQGQHRFRGRYLVHLCLSRQSVLFPGLDPAIEVAVVAVSYAVEYPDKAACPTAAFVIVNHIMQIGMVAELA